MDDPFGSSGSEAPPPYLGGSQPPGISERMQALMSRAEQEVAEQRQLQSLVADVRQSLQQIHDEVRQAAGAHTLETVRGEVTTLGSEVRSATTMLGERLEAVVRAVGAGAQVMQGVGQQLDRVTELLNHQQQQITALAAMATQQQDALRNAGAVRDDVTNVRDDLTNVRDDVTGVRDDVTGVRADVTNVRDDVSSVRTDVSSVRDDVTGVRGEVTALGERVEGVAGQVRADTSAALTALAERIDAAVLALAEALLRPRGAALVEEDAPTTATMTMPVTSPPPWAGAAATEPEETGTTDVADVTDETDEVTAEATAEPLAEETVEATAEPLAEETVEETDDEMDDATDEVAPAVDTIETDTTETETPDETAEPTDDTDETVGATDETDDPTDAVGAVEAATEGVPAADATADGPVEVEPPAEPTTAEPTTAEPTDDTEEDDDDEVPLAEWTAEPDESAGNAFEAAFQDSGEEPSSWGWENVREPVDEDKGEKRRPWWRPGG